MQNHLFGTNLFGEAASENRTCKLADDFIVPPFSVLSARDGAWQDRKRRWLSFGIKSELGRGENTLGLSAQAEEYRTRTGSYVDPSPSKPLKDPARNIGQDLMRKEHVVAKPAATAISQKLAPGGGGCWLGGPKTESTEKFAKRLTWVSGDRDEADLDEVSRKNLAAQPSSGTSIFDPVLCELAYRWFCPLDGQIVDPFAGGSVRGVVASLLGRRYWGGGIAGRTGSGKPHTRAGDMQRTVPGVGVR